MASEMLAHVLLMCGLQFVVDALCVLKVVAIVPRCRELEPSAASNRMQRLLPPTSKLWEESSSIPMT